MYNFLEVIKCFVSEILSGTCRNGCFVSGIRNFGWKKLSGYDFFGGKKMFCEWNPVFRNNLTSKSAIEYIYIYINIIKGFYKIMQLSLIKILLYNI